MELKLEDLYLKCEKCDGTGKFEEVSGSVGGMGVRITRSGPCPECGGVGGKLTDQGRVLKQFMWILESKRPY